MEKVHDRPFAIAAENGIVFVDGPGGVAVALTPEAAVKTSDRLFQQGTAARRQALDEAEPSPQPSPRD